MCYTTHYRYSECPPRVENINLNSFLMTGMNECNVSDFTADQHTRAKASPLVCLKIASCDLAFGAEELQCVRWTTLMAKKLNLVQVWFKHGSSCSWSICHNMWQLSVTTAVFMLISWLLQSWFTASPHFLLQLSQDFPFVLNQTYRIYILPYQTSDSSLDYVQIDMYITSDLTNNKS